MKKILYFLMVIPFVLFGQEFKIGDEAFGGIIFYISETGERGLVAQHSSLDYDNVGGYIWGCDGVDIVGPSREVIGSGYQNTIDIVNYCPEPTAASICFNSEYNGYDDWFLPSNEALMYMASSIGGASSLGNVGQLWNAHWSSSQVNSSEAYEVNFLSNNFSTVEGDLSTRSRVRAVRAFGNWNYGCTDSLSGNYSPTANFENGSCLSWQQIATQRLEKLDSVSEQTAISISSLQQALDTWNTELDLVEGWNMFGYGCPAPIDLVQAMSEHTDNIIIIKDNNGKAYMPEFSFNGIGDLTPGYGYQIKVTEAIEAFSLCDWYVNDIPEDNIVSLQDEIILLHDSINELNTVYKIGDEAFGGIIFYIDCTGEHGLVAGLEDLSDGAIDVTGQPGYEWGCYLESVNGADGQAIGTGYQNTLDIVNQGCSTENGGVTAAEAAFNYVSGGYDDWYLPSIDELVEMYNTIGPRVYEGNIDGLKDFWIYASSTEENFSAICSVIYSDNSSYIGCGSVKFNSFFVRPIRTF